MSLASKLIDSVASSDLSTAAHCVDQGGNPNTLCNGVTAMHIAAGSGVEAVRLMLAYGGDPNIRSVDGSTPLHVAASWGEMETLRLLLHNGADPNIIDQDGLTAMDVARDNSCLDFLKYYTMLVAIGHEEESPMYTSELTGCGSSGPPHPHSPQGQVPAATSQPQPCWHQAFDSSDEEDPVNLSSQYYDALEHRLNRLLRDGQEVCFNVTSPDCPHIHDKCYGKQRGDAQRTILVEDRCRGVSDLYDSDENYKDCSGRRSSFCSCQTRSFDMQGSSSPSGCDPNESYAKRVEQRMRRKYFPDLEKPSVFSGRSRVINDEKRPLETILSCCKPSFFTSLSPQQTRRERVRSTSREREKSVSAPCAHSLLHSSDSVSARSHMFPLSNRTISEVASCQHNSHPSCRMGCQKLSPLMKSSQCKFSRQQCLLQKKESLSEKSVSPRCNQTSHRFRAASCSPSRFDISSECHQNTASSTLSAHSPAKDSMCFSPCHSWKKQNNCDKPYPLPANDSFRKQDRFAPAEGNVSPVRCRSVTAWPVQCDPCCAPPGVFSQGNFSLLNHRNTDMSDSLHKKESPVVGSCSSQSVDSGFSERCSIKQLPAGYLSPELSGISPRSNKSTVPKKNVLSVDATRLDTEGLSRNSAEKNTKSPLLANICVHPKSLLDKDLNQSETNRSDKASNVSSNLRGKGQRDKACIPKWSEKQDDDRMRKEAVGRTAIADLSASSKDSFMTCEENLDPRLGNDGAAEKKPQSGNIHPKLKFKTRPIAGNIALTPEDNCDVKQGQLPVSNSSRFNDVKTQIEESQGFVVSDLSRDPSEKQGTNIHISPEKCHPRNNKSTQNNEHLPKNADGTSFSIDHHAIRAPPYQSHSMKNTKLWCPPAGPLPNDSDIFTSDDSFVAKSSGQQRTNFASKVQSSHLSNWLENLTLSGHGSKARDVSVQGSKGHKRTSDESLLSVASSVQEYIYRDKENGIALIERHIPSSYSGSSGRPSLDTAFSVDPEDTLSYDWTDSTIDHDPHESASCSSSSFDVTAGQTLNSLSCTALEDVDSDSSDEDWLPDDKANENDNRDCETADSDCRDAVQREKRLNKQKNVKSCEKNVSTNGKRTEIKEETTQSPAVTVSSELAALSNEAIFQSLKELGEDPGPVVPSTRQTYLHLLATLQNGGGGRIVCSSQPGYSSELNCLVCGTLELKDCPQSELLMVAQFQAPDGRTWREGTMKSCFNYLLMDPRVTQNLPLRAKTLSEGEAFKTFLSAVFYIGKGKRSRPYCHLYEAISQQKSPKPKVSKKVQQILEIWLAGLGVVSLHCFQNVIPVEAYTREACMVDAIGLGQLTNVKKGDYYGVASTWPASRRRRMGAFLLWKAFQIFLSEGERQICPLDIQKGQ